MCHEWLARSGDITTSFTGCDIAPVATDLRQFGLDWRFVRHDVRTKPLPFADGEFDFVFVKEATGLLTPANTELGEPVNGLDELVRVVKRGGVLEVWDTDHVFRTLLANPQHPMNASNEELEQAERSATYLVSAGTAFAPSQHKELKKYNAWVQSAFSKTRIAPEPCQLVMWALQVRPDELVGVGSRRVAIPFSETRWERESQLARMKGKGVNMDGVNYLTEEQAAIRRATLETSLDMILATRGVLKAEANLGPTEWDKWFIALSKDLLVNDSMTDGECLETGAWWAKRA